HCTAASACRSASSSSVIRLMSDLPASELGHALVPRVPPVSLAGLPCPLRRVIGQDEFLRLRPDDVGYPVVQARRAPPGNGEPAERHTTASFDFCQWLPDRFHRAPQGSAPHASRVPRLGKTCESFLRERSIAMSS